ncbi:Predicted oxidoreductase [Rhizobiales bacterium GAS191]|nr:Predicted oxidoreductase [Rhizobiales bacterium GAS113]SEE82649.1 Predicted oxidoreductase [Rhizobiales bacterium GAS191]
MSGIETIELAPGYAISRVIRGGWQLAGGHGAIDREAAVGDLMAAHDAGIFTFDCADIYTGVEELLGAFRTRLAERRGLAVANAVKVHTKLVPDLDILARISKAHIGAIVDQSLRRLRVERLDLVQFHWWDYEIAGCIDALGWLDELRRDGKIALIGGTNFDTPHVEGIMAAGLKLASMQVQYSVLDQRPEHGLVAACRRHGIQLLCYGSVAGGFLGERWLGVAEPSWPLENRSLVKYKLIIDDFGGWPLFQELLGALSAVAKRHGVDIATIAGRYVLDKPAVAAVIVGARNRAHVAANAQIAAVALSDADRSLIDAVLSRRSGPLGDTYALERDREGRHGSIMKYNLNAKAS